LSPQEISTLWALPKARIFDPPTMEISWTTSDPFINPGLSPGVRAPATSQRWVTVASTWTPSFLLLEVSWPGVSPPGGPHGLPGGTQHSHSYSNQRLGGRVYPPGDQRTPPGEDKDSTKGRRGGCCRRQGFQTLAPRLWNPSASQSLSPAGKPPATTQPLVGMILKIMVVEVDF
jgi:hypothetical protein